MMTIFLLPAILDLVFMVHLVLIYPLLAAPTRIYYYFVKCMKESVDWRIAPFEPASDLLIVEKSN